MRKPSPLDFSHWSVRDLVVYGVGVADSLDTVTEPATRKKFYAIQTAILKELGNKLSQYPTLFAPPRRIA